MQKSTIKQRISVKTVKSNNKALDVLMVRGLRQTLCILKEGFGTLGSMNRSTNIFLLVPPLGFLNSFCCVFRASLGFRGSPAPQVQLDMVYREKRYDFNYLFKIILHTNSLKQT